MPPTKNHYPFYSPRFWHGMRPATWAKLLAQGGFRVDPSRVPMLIGVTATTPFNALMAGVQNVVRRADLADAKLHGPPVFIIGHWRSGTTMLHELLVRDERFGSPTTYQCFAPHHFLVTGSLIRRFGGWLIPGRRPMDNMTAGWELPQEDEFAIMNLGLPSPYRRMAFPRQDDVDTDYLDLEGVPATDRDHWAATLHRFLANVSVASDRPLIVKSPTHTGRVKLLAETFPGAKFVHITRDPRMLYPSTCRLWQSLDDVQGLQRITDSADTSRLHDYVIGCFRRMYDAFHRDRDAIDDGHLIDIRYEDLVADPVETIADVYHRLHLADFETARPELQRWATEEHRQYQPNTHQLDDKIEHILRQHWADYFERYGY